MDIISEKIKHNTKIIKELQIKMNEYISDNNNLQKELINECNKIGHKWIKEREDGMYGNTFHYCGNCGKDKYHDYIHKI